MLRPSWSRLRASLEGSPLTLALLRIVVTSLVLISPETWSASEAASRAAALRVVPEGLRLVFSWVPIDPGIAAGAQRVLIGASIAGLVGLASRLALACVTLAGLYVFGLAQLSGSVLHDMHLLWFSALLSVSPCGDALAVDAWSRARRGLPRTAVGLCYGIPLQSVRMLLGVIYVFPGFWKLRSSGLAWIFSDNLRNQLYWKWYENSLLPAWRIDRVPLLLQLAALGVVSFELSFIACMWSRRTRLMAACVGLAFHAATQLWMFIPFTSLWACYVVLVDWPSLIARNRAEAAISEPSRSPWLPAALLGALLISAAAVQGARGAMQAWPFACYPTFQWLLGDTIPDLRIEALLRDGTRRPIPDGPGTGGRRSAAGWASAWQVAGLYGAVASPETLRAYWQELSRSPAAAAAASGATGLQFYLAYYSVVPERWGAPPVQLQSVGELSLP